MPTDTMILDYARNRTLNLISTLSNYDADPVVYDEVLRIVQQAHDDLDAGQDPGDRIVSIDGKIVEL